MSKERGIPFIAISQVLRDNNHSWEDYHQLANDEKENDRAVLRGQNVLVGGGNNVGQVEYQPCVAVNLCN